ncbi:hypothetical protein SAMN05444959_10224 [Paracoccus seriniphilus]|uniref:Uncharacterized protein n=1 Tax=Paracoccus seriniphilus TaxID=184748 RepID=A0A239PNQ0_9RHOB|nr:hypothetical protein SAMN05444959_10224 [Paracoccus seriniphilus]
MAFAAARSTPANGNAAAACVSAPSIAGAGRACSLPTGPASTTRGLAVASRSRTGRNQVTAPIFLLVLQVKLPERLDMDRDAKRALYKVPGLIVANWVEGPF